MISLKKHLDGWRTGSNETHDTEVLPEPVQVPASGPAIKAPDAAPDVPLEFYRSLLVLVGECGRRAVPELGKDVELELRELSVSLDRQIGSPEFADALAGTHRKAEIGLSEWADQALVRYKSNERSLKEIVDVMAGAIESISGRDRRCAGELGDLAKRLRTISGLNSLAQIKSSITESANQLTVCVDRMAESGRESLMRLNAELQEYRARLAKSEELSAQDQLTGLANRRTFESKIDSKMDAQIPFCLILVDLNEFKAVNDRLGHLAGDEVLKNFAKKLREQFPSADLVARWGGDEFAVILSCRQNEAQARVGRMRRSAFAQCHIAVGKRTMEVTVDASFGVAEWDGQEDRTSLLARADESMYKGKNSMKAARCDGEPVGARSAASVSAPAWQGPLL